MNQSNVRQVALEKILLSVRTAIGEEMLHRGWSDYSLDVDGADGRIVGLHLVARLLAGAPTEEVEVSVYVPVDWWQHFRQRWLPMWWLRRHPVRLARHSNSRKVRVRLCPHLNVPESGPHVAWLVEDPAAMREDQVSLATYELRKAANDIAFAENRRTTGGEQNVSEALWRRAVKLANAYLAANPDRDSPPRGSVT